jgi:hypothetical protein
MPKNLNKILTIFLIFFYVIISWLLRRNGFEHSSGLFYSEKLMLLFNTNENTILTLGFTFPSLVFLSGLAFVPLGYLYAPVAASIVMICGLFYQLLEEFKKSEFSWKLYTPLIFLLFTLHPMFVFAAVTGRRNAIVALVAYLIFRSLLRYYKQPVTYHLSLASIFIACFIFTNYEFIWLVLAFFPFIFLISLDGIKINKDDSPLFQYFEALNNRSQRRKLANRTASIYLVLFLLPLMAVVLFRGLNAQYAGSPTYFLDSQYANWRITGNRTVSNVISSVTRNNFIYQSQIVIQGFILFLTPIFVAALILFRGKLYELFTILAMLFYYSLMLLDYKYTLTLGYYLLFIPIGLVTICYYGTSKYSLRTSSWIFAVSTLLTIGMGFYFFIHTDNDEEYQFELEMKGIYDNWKGPRVLSESEQVANYIASIVSDKSKMLVDDASAYGVVVHIGNLNGLILPHQKSFVTIVENPTVAVKYMLIAKRENLTHNQTVLNAYNLQQMIVQKNLKTLLMFQTKNWAIYQIE